MLHPVITPETTDTLVSNTKWCLGAWLLLGIEGAILPGYTRLPQT